MEAAEETCIAETAYVQQHQLLMKTVKTALKTVALVNPSVVTASAMVSIPVSPVLKTVGLVQRWNRFVVTVHAMAPKHVTPALSTAGLVLTRTQPARTGRIPTRWVSLAIMMKMMMGSQIQETNAHSGVIKVMGCWAMVVPNHNMSRLYNGISGCRNGILAVRC